MRSILFYFFLFRDKSNLIATADCVIKNTANVLIAVNLLGLKLCLLY